MCLARLECGCVVDACDVSDDDTDAQWLYHVMGNGWIVERVEGDATIESDCPDAKHAAPYKQASLF